MSDFRRRLMMAAQGGEPVPPPQAVQLIKDGNFAQGDLTYWNSLRITTSFSGGVLTMTKTNGTNNGYLYKVQNTSGTITDKQVKLVLGHTFIMRADIKAMANVRMVVGNKNTEISGDGTWKRGEFLAVPTTMPNAVVTVGQYSTDGTLYVVEVKNIQLFDLTQMFGAGNEPTLLAFDAMYPDTYYPYYNPSE